MDFQDPGQAAIAAWSAVPRAALEALDPEGDFAKRHLLNPTVFRMLGDVRGLRVLDAGAGQGYFSRLLADRGAQVVSLEPADSLYAYAVEREAELAQCVELLQADLTDVTLEPVFDAVVLNMVLLSIPDWIPALRTCAASLRPGGSSRSITRASRVPVIIGLQRAVCRFGNTWRSIRCHACTHQTSIARCPRTSTQLSTRAAGSPRLRSQGWSRAW